MYLFFVDESGTHKGGHALVVAGVVLHELDVYHLQQLLDGYLLRQLTPLGLDHTKFEIHATEIWRGTEEWAVVPETARRKILPGLYDCLRSFRPINPEVPWCIIGAAVDRRQHDPMRKAYEAALKKFDDYVYYQFKNGGEKQRGLIIHDRIEQHELTLQAWANTWRENESRLGPLRNHVEVPMFTDSKVSRAVQAADLVAYALFKYYADSNRVSHYADRLWDSVHTSVEGKMHGLIHRTAQHSTCTCPPCKSRTNV